jgi:hypothetical protein
VQFIVSQLPFETLNTHVHWLQAPRRVVCTGYGNGGAEAELCGLWAAVTYPAAQIRTVAFGAPVVRPSAVLHPPSARSSSCHLALFQPAANSGRGVAAIVQRCIAAAGHFVMPVPHQQGLLLRQTPAGRLF